MNEIILLVITFLSIIYFTTLLFLLNGLKKYLPNALENDKTNTPKVSIIVSARNEEKKLPGLIKCLENQILKNIDIEFILINDRSDDNTARIIDDIVNNNKRFKAIHISDRINGFAPKKRAIDMAIKQAAGDIILLTDADGRPQNKWVISTIAYFQNGADMVIGYAPYQVKESENIFKKMLALEYFSIAAIALATAARNFPITCVGTNMAYRKKVYEDIDGFGEFKSFISGDDDLLLTRIREAGIYKIVYAANQNCHVFNNPPKSLEQFFNQRLRYASKGFNYPLKVILVLTLYVIFNLSIFSGFIVGIFASNIVLTAAIISFILKSLFEFLFLKQSAKRLADSRFLKFYFPAALLHIPYVLFFGILGQFKFFKWAEKKIEHGISKTVKP